MNWKRIGVRAIWLIAATLVAAGPAAASACGDGHPLGSSAALAVPPQPSLGNGGRIFASGWWAASGAGRLAGREGVVLAHDGAPADGRRLERTEETQPVAAFPGCAARLARLPG